MVSGEMSTLAELQKKYGEKEEPKKQQKIEPKQLITTKDIGEEQIIPKPNFVGQNKAKTN